MKKFSFITAFIAVFLLTVFLSSCEITYFIDKETFNKNKNLRDNQDIKNYEYIFSSFSGSTGPIGPVKVTIKENEEPVLENMHEYHNIKKDEVIKTIPELYDYIDKTIRSIESGAWDRDYIKTIKLNIWYDDEFHYPKKVVLSYDYRETPPIGHGGYTITVTDFSPLE